MKLPGLMDNRQVLIPFVNLKMIGRPFDPGTYQYHQVAFGIEGEQACGISSRPGHDSEDGLDSSHHSKDPAGFENGHLSVSQSACRLGVGESEFF